MTNLLAIAAVLSIAMPPTCQKVDPRDPCDDLLPGQYCPTGDTFCPETHLSCETSCPDDMYCDTFGCCVELEG